MVEVGEEDEVLNWKPVLVVLVDVEVVLGDRCGRAGS